MSDYHGRMMNIQAPPASMIAGSVSAYNQGHRAARHAAAEIANEADLEIDRLRAENARLQGKVGFQRQELTKCNQALAARNRQLDAMAWVWCDGGCDSGVFRFTSVELTEEVVRAAERNTERLRRWLNNAKFKAEWALMNKDEREKWFSSRAALRAKGSTDDQT